MSSNDVLIIGAGAAGCTAAFHLAKAGHQVILLEQKETKNMIKPCGGGMAASVQRWFPFELNQAVDEVISKVNFTWCLKDQVIAELPGSSPFWIVRREILDELILSEAINAGAQILKPFLVKSLQRKGKTWQVTSMGGQQIESKAIVIANGSGSHWPKVLGLGPKIQHHATTTSVRLEGRGLLKEGTARFEFGLVHHGFAWAFPIAGGVNIGVGTFIGRNSNNSEKVLEKLLPNLGFESNAGKRQNSQLRVWNGHHSLHAEGIIAIGDAASLCDPFLAEGLRPAIMSAYEGALALDNWLKDDCEDLSNYSAVMKIKWGNSMAWGKRIAQVFYRFPKVGYQLGIKRPTAPQRIAQILSGEMGYEDIAQRVIKRLLFQRN